MKKLLSLCLLLVGVAVLQAQTPFHHAYTAPGITDDRAHDVTVLGDFTYVFAGRTSLGPGARAAMVMRVDTLGDTLFSRLYGYTGSDNAWDVIPSAGQNFLYVLGTSSGDVGNPVNGIVLMKLTMMGDTVWTRRIEASTGCSGASMLYNSDNTLTIAGSVHNQSTNSSDVLIMNVDTFGTPLWAKQYGTSADEGAAELSISPGASGYLVYGTRQPTGNNGRQLMMLKLNQFGDTVWTRIYGDGAYQDAGGLGIAVLSPNVYGYFLSYNSSGNNPNWATAGTMLLDENGDTLWTNEYTGTSSIYLDGAMAFGSSLYAVGDYDGGNAGSLGMSLTHAGDTNWARTFGLGELKSIEFAFAPGFLAVGDMYGGVNNHRDIYGVRFNSAGETGCSAAVPDFIETNYPISIQGTGLSYSTVSPVVMASNFSVEGLHAEQINQCDSTSTNGGGGNGGAGSSSCTELFFSEYIEGSSNNKALELYNPSDVSVDLSTYSIEVFNNGATTPTNTTSLSGTVAPGDVFVVSNPLASLAGITSNSDLSQASATSFNGNDAVVLLNNSDTVDIIGVVGVNPGSFWTVDVGATSNYTLVRNYSVTGGTTDWAQGVLQWTVYGQDTDSLLGSHNADTCSSIACDSVSASISITMNVSCTGAADGAASVAASGGIAPYLYSWSNGDTTAVGTMLSGGTVAVSVTDSVGCTVVDSATVFEATTLLGVALVDVDPTCNGDGNGSISATASGGLAPYTFGWNTGAATSSVSSLMPGSYTVTLTDSLGCTAMASALISDPPTLIASVDSSQNLSCVGANDGYAQVSATGGVSPLTFQWSNGQSTAAISGLQAQNYAVTTTDANGCSVTAGVSITSPLLLVATVSTKVEYCMGEDGEASTVVTGGTVPYTYSWSNGASDSSLVELSAGDYTVTITDLNGCTTTASGTVLDAPTLQVFPLEIINASCEDEPDGSVSIDVVGGNAPYSYYWSNGSTMATASGLLPGTYSITVTDSLGCSGSTSAPVFAPSSIAPTLSYSPATCGISDGSVAVSVSGGVPPYSLDWSTGDTGNSVDNLAAGTYSVTVEDSNGCTALGQIGLGNLTGPSVQYDFQDDISCFGGSDGAAGILISGGLPPYSTQWSNGDTGLAVTNLSAGSYTAMVSDSLGCLSILTVDMFDPDPITAVGIPTSAQCGMSDGAIYLQVVGGNDPYSFAWSTGATSDTLNGLSAGAYSVTVTDQNGCTIVSQSAISEVGAPSVSASGGATLCYGSSDGNATTSVSSGQPPYTYAWSSGGNSPIESGLEAGWYAVTVAGSDGCAAVQVIAVGQPDSLTLTGGVNNAVEVDCTGDGYVTVLGGTGPFQYLWNDPDTQVTSIATGLCAGSYTVVVTDANGCTDSLALTVDIVAGIEYQASMPGIHVYPNPVHQRLNIQLHNARQQESQLVLMDVTGRTVLNQRLIGPHATIDVSELRGGVYFLRLLNGDSRSVRQVVVQH